METGILLLKKKAFSGSVLSFSAVVQGEDDPMHGVGFSVKLHKSAPLLS